MPDGFITRIEIGSEIIMGHVIALSDSEGMPPQRATVTPVSRLLVRAPAKHAKDHGRTEA
jgi:hypothetical protein